MKIPPTLTSNCSQTFPFNPSLSLTIVLVKHFNSSRAVCSAEQLLSCSVAYFSLQKSRSILSIGNVEESIICPLTLGNQGKGWEDQMLKNCIFFFKLCFTQYLVWEALVEAVVAFTVFSLYLCRCCVRRSGMVLAPGTKTLSQAPKTGRLNVFPKASLLSFNTAKTELWGRPALPTSQQAV